MTRYILYTDGASRGNPGLASIGAVLYREDHDGLSEVGSVSRAIGTATNNVAEYEAVIAGLELAREHEVESLVLRADSQLLVRQLQGIYRVKAANLQPLYRKASSLGRRFHSIRFEHVPREQNRVADALANAALDS